METSRYQLIDSLYGPGTVGAWLLTVSSVLISSTFNTTSRRRDTVTVDFLATLILPLVAAAHLIFLVARLPFPVAEAFTTQDVEIQQYACAIEAPLCICETFSMAALVLALWCGPWWAMNVRMKRLGLVLLVGLLCWGTENVLFVTATIKGVKMTDATLTRPYLFLMPPLVPYVWAYLALVVVCISIRCVIDTIHERRTRNPRRDPERPSSRAKPILPPTKLSDRELAAQLTVAAQKKMETELLRLQQHEFRNQSQCFLYSYYLFLPFMLLCLSLSSTGLVVSELQGLPIRYSSLLIPKSNISIQGLDQIVALSEGFIVLVATVWYTCRAKAKDD